MEPLLASHACIAARGRGFEDGHRSGATSRTPRQGQVRSAPSHASLDRRAATACAGAQSAARTLRYRCAEPLLDRWVKAWASTMCQTHNHAAQSEQMQCVDQGQGITMQSWVEPDLRTMVCWGRDRHLAFYGCRHHKLISLRTSFGISLSCSVKLGSAMSVSDREADENVAYWGGEPARRDRGILVH